MEITPGDDLNTGFGPGDHANPAARLSLLKGNALTEFGEKPNDRLRYFF